MINTILLVMGAGEIALAVILILLLFGAKKIPGLMKGIGEGMKEFKDSQKADENKNEKP